MSRLLDAAAAFADGDEKRGQIASPAPRLTPAQREALLWLPADGGRWQGNINQDRAIALSGLIELGLVGGTIGDWNFRLTPAGIAARQAIERDA